MVMAIKIAPVIPPLSALASILFTSQEGNVISKAPKKLAAKTTKITVKNMLGIQCVDSQFAAFAPNAKATMVPTMVYKAIILKENTAVSLRAMALFLFRMKNETVIGIIGNTQGVSKAVNPLKKAKIKSPHMFSELSCDACPLKVLTSIFSFFR